MSRQNKERRELTIGGTTFPVHAFRAEVTGVGDEVFDSPAGDEPPYALSVRSGTHAIELVSMHGRRPEHKPLVSQAQLKELAKIIIARM